MEYWKERLIKEHMELKEKLDKLAEFLNSDKFDKLSPNNRKLLQNQKIAMELYSYILNLRVKDVDYIEIPDFNVVKDVIQL